MRKTHVFALAVMLSVMSAPAFAQINAGSSSSASVTGPQGKTTSVSNSTSASPGSQSTSSTVSGPNGRTVSNATSANNGNLSTAATTPRQQHSSVYAGQGEEEPP